MPVTMGLRPLTKASGPTHSCAGAQAVGPCRKRCVTIRSTYPPGHSAAKQFQTTPPGFAGRTRPPDGGFCNLAVARIASRSPPKATPSRSHPQMPGPGGASPRTSGPTQSCAGAHAVGRYGKRCAALPAMLPTGRSAARHSKGTRKERNSVPSVPIPSHGAASSDEDVWGSLRAPRHVATRTECRQALQRNAQGTQQRSKRSHPLTRGELNSRERLNRMVYRATKGQSRNPLTRGELNSRRILPSG